MDDLEAAQRAEVVRIALEWERTPWVNEGRIKGKAADCTFFSEVFVESGLIERPPIPHYGVQPNWTWPYLQMVLKNAKREVEESQALPGDVVMFRVQGMHSHGGIIIEPGWPHILHADMNARGVIRADATKGHLGVCQKRFFSFW